MTGYVTPECLDRIPSGIAVEPTARRARDETGLACPGALAIASFDDLPIADAFRPRPRRMHIVLDTRLKIRESTAGADRSAFAHA